MKELTEHLPPELEDATRRLEAAVTLVEETLRRETESRDPLVQEMARHTVFSGGKRLRPRVALLAYRAAGGEGLGDIVDLAAASELVHAASLVHDDIIDGADFRRGSWSLHRKYGTGPAIVTGDFLFTRGFHLAGRLQREVVDVMADGCTRLAEGEVHEQRLAGTEDIDLDEYITIVDRKTAAPIEAAARAGALLAGAPPDVVDALGDYGRDLGLAFQMQDDLLDIEGDVEVTGKPVGLDVGQGVQTLPVILHREEGGDLPRIAPRRRLRGFLESTGAMERARDVADGTAERAVEHLTVLEPSDERRLLESLARLAVDRSG